MKQADNFNPGKWLIENKLTNQSKLGLTDIDEAKKIRDETEDERIERIKYENKKIKDIINKVRETGEFSTKSPDYRWLYKRKETRKRRYWKEFVDGVTDGEKFEDAINQINKILGKTEKKPIMSYEDRIKKIKDIVNKVRETGEFSSRSPDYAFIIRGTQEKYDGEKYKIAFRQIKDILEKKENDRIKQILNRVKETGEFIPSKKKNPDFNWLYNKTYTESTKEKFTSILKQISKIVDKVGRKKEWWGEKTIKKILKQMGFTEEEGQYKFNDCRNSVTCWRYKFDVYLPYNETNYMINKNIPKTGIIFEYDGKQHFESVDYFGGDEKFIEQIRRDQEKNSYCQNHKPNPIKLVRIPYTSNTEEDIKRDIESALNNSSNFVLTGDYPKAGWNQ